MRLFHALPCMALAAGLLLHDATGQEAKAGPLKKPPALDCKLTSSVVGAWKGDERTPTAFERIDFTGNRGFKIYMAGQVSTKGTWSLGEDCVLTARTNSSPQPWVFQIERRTKPPTLLLKEEGDGRPARYSLLDDLKGSN